MSREYILGDSTLTFTQRDALLTVTATDGHARVGAAADERWGCIFQVTRGLDRLEPGYYGELYLELRFEQRCEDGTGVLHGAIHLE